MSGRFVRSSKYRHVYGNPAKKEVSYDNVKVSNNAWDTNLLEANGQYLSLNWQASGGGAFALIPLSRPGKLPEVYPVCRGHTAAVLNTSFSPFNADVIASGGDDANIAIWKVAPEEILERLDSKDGSSKEIQPQVRFSGGRRRVGHVQFHPTAENVLAAATGDHAIKLFDVEKQQAKVELRGFTDSIQSMTFDWTGSTIAATCRDKKLRLFDTRTPDPVYTVEGHGGIKGARAVWCGDKPRLITTGFSKMSERQMFLWDVTQPDKPLTTVSLDSSNGILMPFWSDNNIVFLAGKGDGNIRYYELESDQLHYLTEYKSVEPQSGMAFLPRRSLNVDENEIARMYKVTNSLVQPVSFYVPRRADSFQADIFPPAPSDKPAMEAADFFDKHKTFTPNLLDFETRSILPCKEVGGTLNQGAFPNTPPIAVIHSEDKQIPEEPISDVTEAAKVSKESAPSSQERSGTEPSSNASEAEPSAAEPSAAEPSLNVSDIQAPADSSESKQDETKDTSDSQESVQDAARSSPIKKSDTDKKLDPTSQTRASSIDKDAKATELQTNTARSTASAGTPASQPPTDREKPTQDALKGSSADTDTPTVGKSSESTSSELADLKAQLIEQNARIRELEMDNLNAEKRSVFRRLLRGATASVRWNREATKSIRKLFREDVEKAPWNADAPERTISFLLLASLYQRPVAQPERLEGPVWRPDSCTKAASLAHGCMYNLASLTYHHLSPNTAMQSKRTGGSSTSTARRKTSLLNEMLSNPDSNFTESEGNALLGVLQVAPKPVRGPVGAKPKVYDAQHPEKHLDYVKEHGDYETLKKRYEELRVEYGKMLEAYRYDHKMTIPIKKDVIRVRGYLRSMRKISRNREKEQMLTQYPKDALYDIIQGVANSEQLCVGLPRWQRWKQGQYLAP
ncbi:Coronin-like protein crn1 [Malassezia yamatoensis]|uniref:Coronin n=1 Tax=Malassezia yamatoensis TaxID=253288 RepID=A0AAJ6CIZ9_9BASI|nr:Coronin-like protein crn1 [Malassezia yamatoensis]